jgi:hypothetical protein
VATLLEREIQARPECWYQFYRYWTEVEPETVEASTGNREPGTGFTPIAAAASHAEGRLTTADNPNAQGPRPKAGGVS